MKRGARTSSPGRSATAALREKHDPADPASPEARVRSRRDFMRLMAAGSAAMLAAPAAAAVKAPLRKSAAADTTRLRRPRAEAGGHPMLPAELEKQKKSTADSMKTLRNYALPPGSAPAFVFRPLPQRARRDRS